MLVLFVHQPDRARIVLERKKRVVNELFHGDDGVAGADRQILLLLPQALIHPLEGGHEQPLFGFEIVVQHVLAQAAALRNAVHTRALKTDPGELLGRLLQYLFPDPGRITTTRCHADILYADL